MTMVISLAIAGCGAVVIVGGVTPDDLPAFFTNNLQIVLAIYFLHCIIVSVVREEANQVGPNGLIN